MRADSDWDVDVVQESAFQTDPGRLPVVTRAINDNGEGEGEAGVAKKSAQAGSVCFVQSQVGRDSEKHDVPEGESCDTQLQMQAC